MDTRVAMIGIIVKEQDAVKQINEILHEFRHCIIGRMGIPHQEKGFNIISVALDAKENDISSLAGKLGMLDGVSTKTIYAPKDAVK